jgi:hypothetical protein
MKIFAPLLAERLPLYATDPDLARGAYEPNAAGVGDALVPPSVWAKVCRFAFGAGRPRC